MRAPGFYTCVVLTQLLISVAMLAVAMATRKWLSGSYVRGQTYLTNFDVGLFTVSVDGAVYDRRRFFQSYKEEFQTTVILESFGGGLLLVATGSYILFMIRNSGVAILLYMLTAFLSGIFLLAGSLYFRVNIEMGVVINMVPDYSWYLSLIAPVLALCSFGPLGTAIKKGEFESVTNNVTSDTNSRLIRLS